MNLSFASSFLYFSKNGFTQNIIHNLKYKGRQEIGSFLADLYAPELLNSDLGKVDFVIGVPLHKNKLKKRGFNQVDTFGQTIADRIGAIYSKGNLVRISFNNSQTKKNRIERWKNVSEIFDIENPSEFENKSILIVDDVVTTGATLEACIKLFDNIKGVRVSIATMAITE